MKKRPTKNIKQKKSDRYNKKMEQLGKCEVDIDVSTSFYAPYIALKEHWLTKHKTISRMVENYDHIRDLLK